MGRSYLQRLAGEADWEGCFPGQPILEIAGTGRVLMENHLGILGYSRERILVKVKFGWYSVSGRELEIRRMTKQQLVICGDIREVTVHRREDR